MKLQIIGKGGLSREIQLYLAYYYAVECYSIDSQVTLPDSEHRTLIAIGDPNIRRKIVEKYPNLEYTYFNFGKYPHTSGEGVIICPGTIITTNVKIGKFTIINLNCTIGHDVVIGDFVTISPGANISGNVTIGDNCYIGSNAVIREGITICNDVTIGAGAIVVKDIIEPGTYVLDAKIRKL